MAYQKLTLQDCLQSLADRMTNGVVPADSATITLWTRLLNRGVNFCADKLRIAKQATVTVTGGTYTLPDEFILINKVFNGTTEYTMVDQDDLDNHTGLVYWITGDQFTGFKLNVPTNGSYQITYAYRPAPMSSSSDICIIPDIEAPVAYAYSMKRKASSDPFEDADSSMQECLSRIKEMQSSYSINNNSIDFTWE